MRKGCEIIDLIENRCYNARGYGGGVVLLDIASDAVEVTQRRSCPTHSHLLGANFSLTRPTS
jgi:hypothetical protein